MSLKYTILFLTLTILLIVGALVNQDSLGWLPPLFLYLALAFGQLTVAYAAVGPRIFAKRRDGRFPLRTWLLLGPYLALNHLVWGLRCLAQRDRSYVEAAPNLFFGRRLTAREAAQPHHPTWNGVLDLAPEFSEVPRLRRVPDYRSLPVLDLTAPTEADLRATVIWLDNAVRAGPVYVHCALGYGRSACVVIAYLLATGVVTTAEDGVRRLRGLRPGVSLTGQQVQRLRTLERPVGGSDP